MRLGLQRRDAADLHKGIAVMRTIFAAAAGALIAFSGSALADGVPERYSAPVMLQVFDWSGFYVGLNGGWAANPYRLDVGYTRWR